MRHHLGAHELIPMEHTCQYPDEDMQKRCMRGACRACISFLQPQLGGRVGQCRVGRHGTGSIFDDESKCRGLLKFSVRIFNDEAVQRRNITTAEDLTYQTSV